MSDVSKLKKVSTGGQVFLCEIEVDEAGGAKLTNALGVTNSATMAQDWVKDNNSNKLLTVTVSPQVGFSTVELTKDEQLQMRRAVENMGLAQERAVPSLVNREFDLLNGQRF